MERHEKRLAYQGKIEALLKEWGSQIDRWQDEIEGRQFIEELNRKRQVVRSKLGELKQADDSRWQRFTSDMDAAVEDMKQTVNKVVRLF